VTRDGRQEWPDSIQVAQIGIAREETGEGILDDGRRSVLAPNPLVENRSDQRLQPGKYAATRFRAMSSRTASREMLTVNARSRASRLVVMPMPLPCTK
jgi:hypothetical protein